VIGDRAIRSFNPLVALGSAVLVSTAVLSAQLPSLAEQAVAYSKTAATDPVARLQQRIDGGEARLEFDAAHGYLPAVLKALNVPTASQGLVFSRTSLQVDRIAPWTPRAIYFNDDVYVGWVQGGPIMEVASVDPVLGGVFYTLSQEQTDHPRFERQAHTCLQCHDSSSSTGGIPGFIMRSVVTDRYGYTVATDSGATTDQTPLAKRWGGWYVTGADGGEAHMGNMMAPALAHEMGNVQNYLSRTKLEGRTLADLKDRFDTDPYLTPHSDAVALLVLAHQTSMHNLMTLVRFESRKSTQLGGDPLAPNVRFLADQLVRTMLFTKEAAYPGPISGTSDFARQFAAAGVRDHAGRSLRELDLQRRLFRYPLSYLIYSESFDALPAAVKTYVSQRLGAILSGADQSADFSSLTAADREAIRAIVEDTKPGFLGSPRAD
jgi:hypothetical protein